MDPRTCADNNRGLFDADIVDKCRFPKDCVDLAFDYLHSRHADLNFEKMNESYAVLGNMNQEFRKVYAACIKSQGK